MNEPLQRYAVPFLIGSLLPVLVVVLLGLMNEGFSSIAFLFYPGPETWLQFALLGLFSVLLALALPALRVQAAQSAPTQMLAAGAAGLAFTSLVLYLFGIGETPWRKFYTYVVAPRAVSAWLVLAVAALFLSRKAFAPKRAA